MGTYNGSVNLRRLLIANICLVSLSLLAILASPTALAPWGYLGLLLALFFIPVGVIEVKRVLTKRRYQSAGQAITVLSLVASFLTVGYLVLIRVI